MPGRRRNHCYAPGCKTGYVFKKGGPKIALFGVPKDPNRRKVWEQNLRRLDKPLDDTCAVCELHFEPHFVLRDYVHRIQGQEVRIPRGKPILDPNAVPTILPNVPQYFSKKVLKEKPPRERPDDRIRFTYEVKRNCTYHLSAGPSSPQDLGNDAHREPEHSSGTQASAAVVEVLEDHQSPATCTREDDFIDNLNMPSKFWSKHAIPGQGDSAFYCTSILTSKMEVVSEKVVVFLRRTPVPHSKVYVRGTLLGSRPVRSKLDAELLLAEVEDLHLCAGAANSRDYGEEYFTAGLKRRVVKRDETYFSSNCRTTVQAPGGQCLSCKYFSESLLARKARVQQSVGKKTRPVAQERKLVRQKNEWLSSGLGTVSEDLEL
uniref:Thap domain protein n=1 Tax=Rhipicephalus zambeziensis TaxID=60191 RepID=A0A224Z0Q4_9ACAR